MSRSGSEPGAHSSGAWFATTHWSVVLSAKEVNAAQSSQALETLCRTYWPPIYAFIRRTGFDPASAQDLTQEFFSQFLLKDHLAHLRHQRGKFRSFLLTFVKHFLSAERAKARAQKRGGGKLFLSLDDCSTEEHGLIEAVPDLSAEQLFDRRWAQAVMNKSLRRLRDEYARKGKSALFERLKDLRPGERGELTYEELGASLNMTEEALKTAVLRLRRRQGEILREEIAQTVAGSEDIEEEIRHFMAVLRD
jgi:RNA polymerase sigma-70 factor (ECF subfamily)